MEIDLPGSNRLPSSTQLCFAQLEPKPSDVYLRLVHSAFQVYLDPQAKIQEVVTSRMCIAVATTWALCMASLLAEPVDAY